MNYTLLRHATAVLTFGGRRFLVDPMLDPRGARPPVADTPSQHPNPLVDLPPDWRELIHGVDALVVTHLHRDHLDDTAVAELDHARPLFAQPEDADRLMDMGFSDIRPVTGAVQLDEISLTRTVARHGSGEIGRRMAPASGFVFEAPNESTVYLAGDTIWCPEVGEAIRAHGIDVIVLNAGGARFLEGDPIVMTAEDVAEVHRAAPDALLIVVHLEAINHCLETRAHYHQRLPELGVPADRFRVPKDSESVIW